MHFSFLFCSADGWTLQLLSPYFMLKEKIKENVTKNIPINCNYISNYTFTDKCSSFILQNDGISKVQIDRLGALRAGNYLDLPVISQ